MTTRQIATIICFISSVFLAWNSSIAADLEHYSDHKITLQIPKDWTPVRKASSNVLMVKQDAARKGTPSLAVQLAPAKQINYLLSLTPDQFGRWLDKRFDGSFRPVSIESPAVGNGHVVIFEQQDQTYAQAQIAVLIAQDEPTQTGVFALFFAAQDEFHSHGGTDLLNTIASSAQPSQLALLAASI